MLHVLCFIAVVIGVLL